MIQEIMNVEQLAQYLQIDEQTVYRKARKGEIPSVRIGKLLRFKKEIIDQWLKLASLKWTPHDRDGLRTWGQHFAKDKEIDEASVEKAINKQRKHRP